MKMKKIIVLSILLFVCSFAFGQTSGSNQPEKSGIEKLTFEVNLNRTNYLPFEPLFVKFKVTNQTDTTISAERPQFLLQSRLKVTNPKGDTVEVNGLSLTTGGGVNLPGGGADLKPFQFYEEENVPAIDPNIFVKQGNYQLQFFLNGLESNVVEMKILNPKGINKEAFEFINEHGKDIWFGSMLDEKNGDNLLKAFVQKFGESDYAKYAINSLGNYYLFFQKDLDKAQAEFEKLKNSENVALAQNANKTLVDIAQKKANLQKLQNQKEKP
jgi:hypothetical protein